MSSTVIRTLQNTISGGGINKKPIDPLDNTEYVYSSLAEGKAYQIKINYEGEPIALSVPEVVNTVYAAPGAPTIAYIRGNYNQITAKSSTGGVTCILAVPSIIANT